MIETLEGAAGKAGAQAGAPALLVDLLDALSEADSLGTGPGVWSPWRRTLVQNLAGRCRSALTGAPFVEPGPPDPSSEELVAAMGGGGGPQVRFVADGDVATVTLVLPDDRGALSAAAGVLALHSLQVHTAETSTVATPDGGSAVVETFAVAPRFGGLPDPALVRADLVRVLSGSLALGEALARKERDYAPSSLVVERTAPPRVLWFDDEATGAVVLELRATDRIGLLHHVTAALERCGVDLRWARVETLGASVVDAFGVAGMPGPGARRTIEAGLLAVTAARGGESPG